MQKLQSRKFWVMVVSNVVAMIILFFPEQEAQVNQWNELAGAVIMTLTNLGYLHAQGKVDAEEVKLLKQQ